MVSNSQTSGDPASVGEEAGDLAHYKESAGIRLRFALWRSIGLVAFIYLGNVVINALDVALHNGAGALSQTHNLSSIFFVDAILRLSQQLPSILASFAAVAVISVLLTVTARIRFAWRKNAYRKQLSEFRRQRLRDFQQEFPRANVDVDADTAAWVAQVLGKDGSQRRAKLLQIEEWFKYDELLVQWTSLLVERKQFARDILYSILASTGAVLIARILLILR